MNRRHFAKLGVLATAGLAAAPSVLLTGCNAQTDLEALLTNMQADYTAFKTALGQTPNPAIVSAFTAAIAAVKAWVPGSAAQDVIQVLQELSTALLPMLTPILGPAIVAAAQVLIGAVTSLIELFGSTAPAAVASVAHANVVPATVPISRTPKQWEAAIKALHTAYKAQVQVLKAKYPNLG